MNVYAMSIFFLPLLPAQPQRQTANAAVIQTAAVDFKYFFM